jgi:hypothetical protein
MRAARIALSCLFAIAAILALLVGYSTNPSLVESTIAKNHVIDDSLRVAAAYIDDQLRTTGSLPTEEQLRSWGNSLPSPLREIDSMWIDVSPFDQDVVMEHGEPSSYGYVLKYWRGEWEESYVSWTGKTSLTFDPSDYYILGNERSQRIAAVMSCVVLVVAAAFTWPRKRHVA